MSVWKDPDGWLLVKLGELFLAIHRVDLTPYASSAEPNETLVYYEWYIMPDDEDKCDERAFWSWEWYHGNDPESALRPRQRLTTFEMARDELLEAVGLFIARLSDEWVKLREAARGV